MEISVNRGYIKLQYQPNCTKDLPSKQRWSKTAEAVMEILCTTETQEIKKKILAKQDFHLALKYMLSFTKLVYSILLEKEKLV